MPADRSLELAELRRSLQAVAHRPRRERLLKLVAQLEREADHDPVDEIRATRLLDDAVADRDAARAEAAAARAEAAGAEAALGSLRREHEAALALLAELRELAGADLADELVEIQTRIETERPTSPPLLVLRRAARLARAVRGTAP